MLGERRGEGLEHPRRATLHVRITKELSQAQQELDREKRPGGGRVVGHLTRSGDQTLVVVRRVEEDVGAVVPERCDDRVSQRAGPREPGRIERELVEREESECDGRVVFEKPGDVRPAVLPRSRYLVLQYHLSREEFAGAKRGRAPVCATEHARAVGEGAKHEPIPRRKHLLVAPWPHPRRSPVVQPGTRATSCLLQLRQLNALPCGDRGGLVRHVKDVVALEVPAGAHSPIPRDECGVLTRDILELRGTPYVELALLTFTVGIEGGIEPALG